MSDTSMVESSQKWVDGELSLCRFGEKELPGIRASELYKWLEVDDARFRQWFDRRKKSLQLVEGKDFVNFDSNLSRNSERGRKRKDYILTPHSALQFTTQTLTPKGLATLKVLTDLALKVNEPDYQFVKAINKRYEEIHGRPVETTTGQPRPWSQRLTLSFRKHFSFVSSSRPGWWSVLIGVNTIFFVLEDILMDHCLPCRKSDLPDGSIGKHWAAYRRELGFTEPEYTAPLYLPETQQTVHAKLYSPDERGIFEAWLFNTYFPEHLPQYFGRKYTKEGYPILPPHSAADCACRELSGKPVCLPDSSRQAIDNSPERIIRAAAERPSLN